MVEDFKIYLKAFSQIMLQESAITGLLFLAAIAVGSTPMAIGSLMAVVISTLIAKIFRFNAANLRSGLYGFSAALVGAALPLFLTLSYTMWLAVMVGAVIATLLQELAMRHNFPAYTFPFVVTTWLALILLRAIEPSLLVEMAEILPSEPLAISKMLGLASIRGFGQVVFQASVFSGLLMIIGMFYINRVATFYALLAALSSALLIHFLGLSAEEISLGVWGFNAVLVAVLFAEKGWFAPLWVALGVVLSLIISITFRELPLPQLTFPFVAASWVTLLVKRTFEISNSG